MTSSVNADLEKVISKVIQNYHESTLSIEFNEIKEKFGNIDAKFDNIDAKFDKLNKKVDDNQKELIEILKPHVSKNDDPLP